MDGKVQKFEFKASRIPRNEAYLGYAAVTRDEAQRRNRTFYEAINIEHTTSNGEWAAMREAWAVLGRRMWFGGGNIQGSKPDIS